MWIDSWAMFKYSKFVTSAKRRKIEYRLILVYILYIIVNAYVCMCCICTCLNVCISVHFSKYFLLLPNM